MIATCVTRVKRSRSRLGRSRSGHEAESQYKCRGRKMRVLLLLSCLIATAAPLSGQIGYPSIHSNFDERKVGAYQLPDLLTTSDGVRITDEQAWYKIRRPEIDRLLEEQEYGRSPSA